LGTITGEPYRLNLEAGTGNVLLPRQVNVGQFSVTSAQTFFLGEGITTANTPLTFTVPTVLTQNSALRTGTPGAAITFNNTLNSEAGEQNNLNLAAGSGDITINDAVGNGTNQQLGNITIESVNNIITNAPIQSDSFQQTGTPATGNITLNESLTTGNGGVNLNATGAVTANTITTNGGGIGLTGNTVTADTLASTGGDINVTGTNNVVVTNATSNGSDIALESTAGSVQANTLSATGGTVNITASGTVSVPTINSTDGVSLTSTGSNIQTSTVTTNGGDIALSSSTDTITVDTLSSTSGTAAGGNITVLNPNAITAGAIDASGATTGGNITLSAIGGTPTGAVTTGNLTTTGTTSGGNVTVLARDTITTSEINTSATVGNGGDVLLDPDGDVQVTFINAQGGTAAGGTGVGGDVFIVSVDRFFRATGSFIDQNNINASISAAGRGGEGRITITHNGGAADVLVPFIISRSSDNGTVGALTTGANNIIFPGSFLGPYTQGNIRIITSPQATLAADGSLPDTLPEEIQPENADNQPFWLDEYFTRTLEEYLSRNPETAIEPTRIKSLEEIQDELREIARVTSARPAVIYVVFEPQQLRLRTEVVNGEEETQQDRLTNQGTVLRQAESHPDENTDQLQLVLVTADEEPFLYRVPDPHANRREVLQLINELRRKLIEDYQNNYLSGINSQGEPYLEEAQQMYDWLVRGLESRLQERGVNNLVFIADNGIRSVPLAAMLPIMHDGQRFIIEQGYSVGLMPSFSLTDTHYQDIRQLDILAAGASTFPQTGYSDLPAVEDELAFLDEHSFWSATILSNEEFSFDRLSTQRQQNPFGIIHFATHARFRPGDLTNSYIQLYQEKLRLHDFRALGWNNPPIEMVVLSACNTARDSIDAELGFAGLAVQTGVKSALASIWRVDDFGTFALMSSFYNYLGNSDLRLIKAESLRLAQMDMLRGNLNLQPDTFSAGSEASYLFQGYGQEALSHPYLWSGFTIIGNPW
jgi:CHAT domain-containing protein